MNKPFVYALAIFILSFSLFAQQPAEKPAWNVTLEANKTARSNITVQNRCQKTHNFQIQPQNVPFLNILQTEVSVNGGGNANVPVQFNTANLSPQTYRGNVLVICITCSSEATCTQDRENLPVILNITDNRANIPVPVDGQTPCSQIIRRCDELLVIANSLMNDALTAQTAADKARQTADQAEQDAQQAEQESRMADEAAKDDKSDYKANVNGQEYSSADTAYLEVLRLENQAALAAGSITTDEFQRRSKELTAKKAREERLKNKKRLKKEAQEAKKKAEAKRKAAEKAKKEADEAQSKADETRAKADKARRDYDECMKKAQAECEKIKAEQERLAAEKKKSEAAAAAAAAAAEKLKKAEEERKKREIANAAARRKYNEYLIDNIRRLGLIDSSAVREVPSLWQWLPDFLETPVTVLLEQKTATPIPTDTLKALGGLYGIIGKMLDPCTALGQSKTVARLQEMVNPHTEKKYTFGEALKKTADMCKLLRELRGKLRQIQKAQKK